MFKNYKWKYVACNDDGEVAFFTEVPVFGSCYWKLERYGEEISLNSIVLYLEFVFGDHVLFNEHFLWAIEDKLLQCLPEDSLHNVDENWNITKV